MYSSNYIFNDHTYNMDICLLQLEFFTAQIADYLAKLSDASYTPVVQIHYQLQFVSFTD